MRPVLKVPWVGKARRVRLARKVSSDRLVPRVLSAPPGLKGLKAWPGRKVSSEPPARMDQSARSARRACKVSSAPLEPLEPLEPSVRSVRQVHKARKAQKATSALLDQAVP